MLEGTSEYAFRVDEFRTKSRQQPRGAERPQPLKRGQVVGEIAAAGRLDHHTAAVDDEIAGKDGPRWLVPERNVVGRVSGRVQRDQRLTGDNELVAVSERRPVDRVKNIFVRPWVLQEARGRMPSSDRGRTRRVIRMGMRDEHVVEARAAFSERV